MTYHYEIFTWKSFIAKINAIWTMRSHFFLLLQEKVLYEINKLIIDDSKEDVCFIFWLLLFSLNLVKRSVYDRNQVKLFFGRIYRWFYEPFVNYQFDWRPTEALKLIKNFFCRRFRWEHFVVFFSNTGQATFYMLQICLMRKIEAARLLRYSCNNC